MPHHAFCLPPCERGFRSHNALAQHRLFNHECRNRWNAYLAQQANALYALHQAEDNLAAEDLQVLNVNGRLGDNVAIPGEDADMPMADNMDLIDNLDEVPQLDIDMDDAGGELWDVGMGNADMDIGAASQSDDQPVPIQEEGVDDDDVNSVDLGSNSEPRLDDEYDDYDQLNPSTDGTAEHEELRYEGAARIRRRIQPPFEELLRAQLQLGQNNYHYPFPGSKEWELASWLHDSELSRSSIDSFIKLKMFEGMPLSFQSAAALVDRIEALPSPRTLWLAADVVPNSGAPIGPVRLYYRNPVDAIQSLLQRPELKDALEFIPRKVWDNEAHTSRVYNEIFTGKWAWKTQTKLPVGGALIPVILASDKTHLTDFSGDKKAWPLYLSVGNIKSSVRNKPGKNAWVLISYLPCVKFSDHQKIQTALQDRLFHQCMKLILQPLVRAGQDGKEMSDSAGNIRHCFPLLAFYIADYPEQQLINIAANSNSPATTASRGNLGSSGIMPPRTRKWILTRVRRVCAVVNPLMVLKYQEAAKELGLNAVYQPFWEDLPGYKPELCIGPDILHGLLKLWRDHVLKWVRNLVGVDQLDARLKVLQPMVGFHHFNKGVKHMSQWSGREDRELQRVLVAVIAGSPKVDSRSMRCFRAFHDFIYLAQYHSHSTGSLQYLSRALSEFHTTKGVLLENGARSSKKVDLNHFEVPKIASMHLYPVHIPEMGSSPQFSTEIAETLHKTMAKTPYQMTNRREFEVQMCRYLDRVDKIVHMNSFLSWARSFLQEHRIMAEVEEYPEAYQPRAMQAIRDVLENEQEVPLGRRRRAQSGRIWHALIPHAREVTFKSVCARYHLSEEYFSSRILRFLSDEGAPPIGCGSLLLDIWHRFRIQISSVQDFGEEFQSRTIQALPPTNDLPYGRCDTVLVHDSAEASPLGIKGFRIAQVKLVFRLVVPRTHPYFRVPLALIYWFTQTLPRAEKDVKMYLVKHSERANGSPLAAVIELNSIQRCVQLIPRFTSQLVPQMTEKNMMELHSSFWVNSFMDKETYQSVY